MYANKREAERRGMLRVELPVGNKIVNFVTTHLDYQYADGRLFEAEQMLSFLDGVNGPIILVGDLNDEPVGSAYKLITVKFHDAWSDGIKTDGLSYPADKPVKRIDYIFYRKDDAVRPRKSWVVDTEASDHRPVMSELEIR